MFTLARYKIVLCSLGTQSLYNSVHICSIALFQMPFLYVRVEESARSGLPWNKQKTCSTGTRCPFNARVKGLDLVPGHPDYSQILAWGELEKRLCSH